ncbi:MAG: hypothetical protein EA369_02260 [Bradymonadales bacterium]|nr:MAG: hypothetical protein EA369_02260 [Bradymonadales bacterium]
MARILHIFTTVDHKYRTRFIDFVGQHDLGYQSTFLYWERPELSDSLGQGSTKPLRRFSKKLVSAKSKILFLIRLVIECHLRKNDHYFLHGLFTNNRLSPMILVTLNLMSRDQLRTVCWRIWGGDLYGIEEKPLLKTLKKRLVQRIGCAGTLLEGDVQAARLKYEAQNLARADLSYPLVVPLTQKSVQKNQNDKMKILVGNSATPTNQHEEIFRILAGFELKNFEIHCPLAYGDTTYRTTIEKLGHELFPKSFYSTQELITPAKYHEFISTIDIAIFNTNRQQAVGTILLLLYLQKKVYLPSSNSPFAYFLSLGLKIHDTSEIKRQGPEAFLKIDPKEYEMNQEIVFRNHSDQATADRWRAYLCSGMPRPKLRGS